MTVVAFEHEEFCDLVGKRLSMEEVEAKVSMMGAAPEGIQGTLQRFDINPNRPDWLSIEGIARAFRGVLGIEEGLPKYEVRPSKVTFEIDESVREVRPFAAGAIVDAQDPIIVGSTYAPQPDVALLRPTADYYASRTPAAADCLLVIEVSESSAEFDRQIKVPRYARGAVAELWLVELERDLVVVHQDPAGDAYQRVRVCRRGETITPGAFQGTAVAVDAILG